MPNWHESMQQTFEYFIVDPLTWKDKQKLSTVKKCQIERDSDTSTLGSASFDITDNLGECYIRAYLVTIQNGVTERFPLGTFLLQTPSTDFDGRVGVTSVDAYTPLLELKDDLPPLGYTIQKGQNALERAYTLAQENTRAPVIKPGFTLTGYNRELKLDDHFVADTDDTWLSYLSDLLSLVDYSFGLDELSQIIFVPEQELESLQPVWTYSDDDSSIIYPEVTIKHDYYDIPNVVEVTYSTPYNNTIVKTVENDDVNSPVSITNRGRRVTYRASYPSALGNATEETVEQYAKDLLKALSKLEFTVSYTHGYCPVRLGDCVRLNYSRAGLDGVNAKVISQTIKCGTGCEVTEKAVFTTNLWG